MTTRYLLAKIGVDTAENEPLEVWGRIQFINSFASLVSSTVTGACPEPEGVILPHGGRVHQQAAKKDFEKVQIPIRRRSANTRIQNMIDR